MISHLQLTLIVNKKSTQEII